MKDMADSFNVRVCLYCQSGRRQYARNRNQDLEAMGPVTHTMFKLPSKFKRNASEFIRAECCLYCCPENMPQRRLDDRVMQPNRFKEEARFCLAHPVPGILLKLNADFL